MKKFKIATNSEKETIDFASNYIKRIANYRIISLVGELGVGKTMFVKGLAKGLKIKQNIDSPSFVLMKNYKVNNQFIKNFIHIDCYYINNPKEILSIGIEEWLNRDDTFITIEWANKIRTFLPKKIIYVKINYNKEKNNRTIKILEN